MGRKAEIPISSFPSILPGTGCGKSLYLCVYDAIRETLLSGSGWEAGTLLPSESDLAVYWNVSKGTVREALYHLFEDGVICKSQGRRASLSHLQHERSYVYQTLVSPVRAFCTEPLPVPESSYRCVGASDWMASMLSLQEGVPLVKGVLDYRVDGEFRARTVFFSSFSLFEKEGVCLDDGSALAQFIEDRVYRMADTSRSSLCLVDEVGDSEISPMPFPLLFMEDYLHRGDSCFIALRYYLDKDWFRVQTLRKRV